MAANANATTPPPTAANIMRPRRRGPTPRDARAYGRRAPVHCAVHLESVLGCHAFVLPSILDIRRRRTRRRRRSQPGNPTDVLPLRFTYPDTVKFSSPPLCAPPGSRCARPRPGDGIAEFRRTGPTAGRNRRGHALFGAIRIRRRWATTPCGAAISVHRSMNSVSCDRADRTVVAERGAHRRN